MAVVVLSDGWDRGDPVEMRTEMCRLRQRAQKVVWHPRSPITALAVVYDGVSPNLRL